MKNNMKRKMFMKVRMRIMMLMKRNIWVKIRIKVNMRM